MQFSRHTRHSENCSSLNAQELQWLGHLRCLWRGEGGLPDIQALSYGFKLEFERQWFPQVLLLVPARNVNSAADLRWWPEGMGDLHCPPFLASFHGWWKTWLCCPDEYHCSELNAFLKVFLWMRHVFYTGRNLQAKEHESESRNRTLERMTIFPKRELLLGRWGSFCVKLIKWRRAPGTICNLHFRGLHSGVRMWSSKNYSLSYLQGGKLAVWLPPISWWVKK